MFQLLVLVLISLASSPFNLSLNPEDEEWVNFKKKFNKTYQSEEEESHRKKLYFGNKRVIEEHNTRYEKGSVTFKLGINAFADRNREERPKHGLRTKARSSTRKHFIRFEATGAKLPPEVDWRQNGIVTPVKQQLDCLSCYAFSVVDTLESHYALKYGKKIELSPQQVIDCSRTEGNLGCVGGELIWTYEYIKKSGMQYLSDYPYENKEGICRFNSSKIAAKITNYVSIKSGSEISLQEAVAFYGPVSVGIDSNSFEWDLYVEGVYSQPECRMSKPNHGATVVGYGAENGQDYWLVKNTEGTEFGMEGYIKMVRNQDNNCAIASDGSFPVFETWKQFKNKVPSSALHKSMVGGLFKRSALLSLAMKWLGRIRSSSKTK